jgi:hypothetical protein
MGSQRPTFNITILDIDIDWHVGGPFTQGKQRTIPPPPQKKKKKKEQHYIILKKILEASKISNTSSYYYILMSPKVNDNST